MYKVLFVTSSLGGGGAERVLVNLVNHMDKTKFDVSVKTLFGDGINLNGLSDDVHYKPSHFISFKGITYILKLVPAEILYRLISTDERYDVIVAFLHGIPVKVVSGCRSKNTKLIAWLHYGDPEKGSFFNCWLSKKSAFRAYSGFDRIVGVSQAVSEAFKRYTHIKDPVVTLYNVNDTEKIKTRSQQEPLYKLPVDGIKICTVGRLAKQKGYDRLICAAKRLYDDGCSFHLYILGEGREHRSLQRQIDENNLGDTVHLTGFCENPYSIMAQCDFFVSSSREEGMATVLTEALTLGLPVMSSDVSGAKEVLGENNEYGLVVDNSTEGIYEGLKKMTGDKELLKKYASLSAKRAELFDTSHTVKAVEDMIEELCRN